MQPVWFGVALALLSLTVAESGFAQRSSEQLYFGALRAPMASITDTGALNPNVT